MSQHNSHFKNNHCGLNLMSRSAMESKIDSLTRELEDTRKALEREKRQKEEGKKELVDELQSAKDEVTFLQQELKKATDSCHDISRCEKDVADLTQQIEELQAQGCPDQLKAELKKESEKTKSLQEELQKINLSFRDEVENMTKDFASAQKQTAVELQREKEENKSLQAANAQSQKQIKCLRNCLRKVTFLVNNRDQSEPTLQLQQELAVHKATISNDCKVIDELTAENSELKKVIVAHQNIKQSHDTVVKTLKQQINELILRVQQERANHKGTISNGCEVIHKLNAEIRKLKEITVSHQNIQQCHETVVKTFKQQIDELKLQVQQERANHKGTISNGCEVIEKLNAEIEELKKGTLSQQNIKQSHEKVVKTLNQQIDELKLQLQQEGANHESTIRNGCEVMEKLNVEIAQLKKATVSHQHVRQSHEKVVKTLNQQIDGLTDQLQEERANHKSTIRNGCEIIEKLNTEIEQLKNCFTVSHQHVRESHETVVKTMNQQIDELAFQLQKEKDAQKLTIKNSCEPIHQQTEEMSEFNKIPQQQDTAHRNPTKQQKPSKHYNSTRQYNQKRQYDSTRQYNPKWQYTATRQYIPKWQYNSTRPYNQKW